MVEVEVVYLPREGPFFHKTIKVQAGLSVGDVLKQSGVFQSHPETRAMPVGLFSQRVLLTRGVKAHDRIEIYRPLLMDPKEKRRQRLNLAVDTSHDTVVKK